MRMTNLRERLGFKAFMTIFSYLLALVFAVSAAAAVAMGYYKFYFGSLEAVTADIMTDMAEREAGYIENMLFDSADLEAYYANKNVFYRVKIEKEDNGETVYGNFSGQEYIASAEYVSYYDSDPVLIDENGNEYIEYNPIEKHTVTVYVAKNMKHSDIFSVARSVIGTAYKLKYAAVFIMLGSLIAEIAILFWLFCAAGHKNGEIKCSHFDLIPFDLLTAAIIAVTVICICIISCNYYDVIPLLILCLGLGSVLYFAALLYTLSFAVRLKTHTLLKNNVIYRLLCFIARGFKLALNWFKYVFSDMSLIHKTVAAGAVVILFELAFILFGAVIGWPGEFALILLIVLNAVSLLLAMYFAVILQRIKNGGEKIAGGDLSFKISTEYMFGDFKQFSESLNNINLGLQAAVNEKMKSEHFKTELITNVSHDIKTPLTSIINYVDLIKKEKVESEAVREYIDVLDRQSGRLKKLVEDLVEASKASTGNLPIKLDVCDVGVLLNQTLGEFEDKLSSAEIYPILKLPEESVKIMADGRYLWRVFDNLMNNVCKYAQPKTRLYLDVIAWDGKAMITFRNISKYQLNITSEELMERFVRGDSSRNTEGSGLGLSIARSLIDLQNGKLELSVDGDLFKVCIIFDTVE